MGLRIATNTASIAAQRVLSKQQKRAEHAAQALASGSRIVNAADDAAGLAISENFKGQLKGIGQARNNANNAISFVQVSEGGLNEVSNILVRLRELGVQAASDTVSDTEREFLNKETQQLIQEADRIAKTTVFGTKKMLDGTAGAMEFQVGAYSDENNVIKFEFDADSTASALGIDSIAMAERGDARASLEQVDQAIEKVSGMRANFGAMQSRMESAVSNLDVSYENLSAANSRIRDTDVAKETAEMTSASILQNTAVSVLAQANQLPQVAMKLV
ncbi:flagellin N-terminal helical domain-containing protein [Bdellovibrio bacteriovorus]|uniref:Flagellin n=1 Tax=Bdellovibrio bacteriovorus str. Tiberius TaxID=1069642 RepID=K7YRP2_BDEBC|nr:flagellin [Bdellovibrio bacteriovorus]AFY00283.1 flagellin [Bdellovibrio bacteriovorus str. Tiberius]